MLLRSQYGKMRRQNRLLSNTCTPPTCRVGLICSIVFCILAQFFTSATGKDIDSPKGELSKQIFDNAKNIPIFIRKDGQDNQQDQMKGMFYSQEKSTKKNDAVKQELEEFLSIIAFQDGDTSTLNSSQPDNRKTTKNTGKISATNDNQGEKLPNKDDDLFLRNVELNRMTFDSFLGLSQSNFISHRQKTSVKRSMNTFQPNPSKFSKKFQLLFPSSFLNVSSTVATNLLRSFDQVPETSTTRVNSRLQDANYYNKHYYETILSTSTRGSDVVSTRNNPSYDAGYDNLNTMRPTVPNHGPVLAKHGNHCEVWQHACADGKCIESDAYCDGVVNCDDYSDEMPGCTGKINA